MKILMVNKFLYPVGGCENYMLELADALKKNGHEVQFFGLKSDKNSVGNEFNIYVDNYNEKKIFNPFSIVCNKKAKKAMKKILDLYKPDLVHMNNVYYHLTSSIVDACKAKKIPVVMTVHDSQLVCPSHNLYRFDIDSVCDQCVRERNARACKKYKCIKNSKLKSTLGVMEFNKTHKKHSYDYVSYFLCPSEFIKDKLIDGGYNAQKTILMRNFKTLDKPSVLPSKKDYVLFFGRLSKEKGVELLLDAWPENKQLYIVGTGPVEERIKRENKPYIKHLGFKTGEELNVLIKEALFSISPSTCYENCPLSVIESISNCTPVIAANAGGYVELVDDQVNGLLFENNNPEDLRSKIEYLFKNKDILEKMTKNCLSYKRVPSLDEYYDELMKIYSRL